METKLRVEMLPQPDDCTCGPTCLHALYRYYGDDLPLEQVIAEVPMLDSGGTLDVLLANHALSRGYSAKIFTYNVQMFDPSWFDGREIDLAHRLKLQLDHDDSHRLRVATEAYLSFLERGGQLRYEELTASLIRKYLIREIPILTGLSATYLYRTMREFGTDGKPDDIRGKPAGHFVLLCGYDKETREVLVADPLKKNPISQTHSYVVSIDRVICAILLGILTYDSNFLIIEPRRPRKLQGSRADSHRRQ
ncbi:MAG: C39 family peptidase [Planctomycetes bacterium]|nr:C39 family peptidase [Planctomycetota bacterium]